MPRGGVGALKGFNQEKDTMAASKNRPKPEFLDSLDEAARVRDQLNNIFNRRAKKLAKINAQYDVEISEVVKDVSKDAKEHLLKLGFSKFDLEVHEDVTEQVEDVVEPVPETKPALSTAVTVEYETTEGDRDEFMFTRVESVQALSGLELTSAVVAGPEGALLDATVAAVRPLLRGDDCVLDVNGVLSGPGTTTYLS
jgi:hypothetical protein